MSPDVKAGFPSLWARKRLLQGQDTSYGRWQEWKDVCGEKRTPVELGNRLLKNPQNSMLAPWLAICHAAHTCSHSFPKVRNLSSWRNSSGGIFDWTFFYKRLWNYYVNLRKHSVLLLISSPFGFHLAVGGPRKFSVSGSHFLLPWEGEDLGKGLGQGKGTGSKKKRQRYQ